MRTVSPLCQPKESSAPTALHVLKHRLLELAVLNLLARVIGGGLAVERKEVTKVELGCLEELDLADVDLS